MTFKVYTAGLSAILFLTITVLSAPAAHSQSRPKIIWRTIDWPPFYIRYGPHENEGLFDKMIAAYQAALPQFDHVSLEMSTMRAVELIKDRSPNRAVCHASATLNTISEIAHISKVNSIHLHQVIFARKEAAARILSVSKNSDGYVSIEKLMHEENLRGAITAFGAHPALEKFQYLDKPFPNITLAADEYQTLALLLLNGRVDYIVQYLPYESTLLSQGGTQLDFVVIPIEETRNEPYIEGYVGCTKNAVGKTVIAAVNRVLASKPKSFQEARIQCYPQRYRAELITAYKKFEPELNNF